MKAAPDKKTSAKTSAKTSVAAPARSAAPAQAPAQAAPTVEESASPTAAGPESAPVAGLTSRQLRLLQAGAGNAAVARLVVQRQTAAAPSTDAPAPPVKPPPSASPAFQNLKSDVRAKKTAASRHSPAATESKAAQNAAVAPPDDKQAQGKAAQAEKMNAAKPGVFDKAGFIAAVNQAIAAQAPKNLDEADNFSESGKADAVKGQVSGQVSQGKAASAKEIDTATKAGPDLSKAQDKPVTPLTPDAPPPVPGTPDPAGAVPARQPDAVTDFSGGPEQVNQQMADAEVTEDQLAKSNEPQFTDALGAKKEGEQHSATAPGQARGAEAKQLAAAKQGAAATGAQAMTGLAATRTATGKQVDGGKSATKSADERKRAEVTARLQKVFDGTKTDVEKTLSGLDKLVDDTFTAGEKAARDAFTADHKRRMDAYKDKRYSGWTGKLKWVKDKFAGMPEEANQLFQESRKLYVAQMQQVISSIADLIGTELGKAKDRIARGRTELKAEVDKLPADLKKFGQEAAKDFTEKFDGLEADVNAKSDQLVQDLAQKYTQALNAVDDEIKKLQEENKGLIAKVKDAVVGVIQTIIELKNMLLGILAKAATAVMNIIKDPIGFLRNLVTAVGAGLKQFMANIGDHLKKGLISWLLGTAVSAGLALPAKFDLKGIIQLIGGMLGLTWANIRARITRKGVPDQAVTAAEQSVPVAQALQKEGPAGAVDHIKASVGDLKSTILQKLTAYLIPTVIVAGITWIVSLLNPASAFIRAVKGIIDIVTFVVTQGAQIMQFVNSILDAVIAIASGGGGGVPALIEGALVASIPVLIGFLAALLGVGNLANKVKEVFHAVAKPVNKAIDKIVDFIAKAAKNLWARLKGKGKNGKDSKGKDSPKSSADREKDAVSDAQKLLTPDATHAGVQGRLPGIARTHGVPLRLVVDSRSDAGEVVHVQTTRSDSKPIGKPDPDANPNTALLKKNYEIASIAAKELAASKEKYPAPVIFVVDKGLEKDVKETEKKFDLYFRPNSRNAQKYTKALAGGVPDDQVKVLADEYHKVGEEAQTLADKLHSAMTGQPAPLGPLLTEAKFEPYLLKAVKNLGGQTNEVLTWFAKIAPISGSEKVLKDVATSHTTVTGAIGEIRYAAWLIDEGVKITLLGETYISPKSGKSVKGLDIIVNFGEKVIEFKNYEGMKDKFPWDSPKASTSADPDKLAKWQKGRRELQEQRLQEFEVQAARHRERWPDAKLEFVFKSPLSDVPQELRDIAAKYGTVKETPY
ncbi:phage tail protein [Streptomyces sp. NPDC002920]